MVEEKTGELWLQNAMLFVRHGVTFYPLRRDLLPRDMHEYDEVVFTTKNGNVGRICRVVRAAMQKRPYGLRAPPGIMTGKVTYYDRIRGTGNINNEWQFDKKVVRSLGGGETVVGESVEFSVVDGAVCTVTGPCGSYVSMCGRRLS